MKVILVIAWLFLAAAALAVPWLVTILAGLPPQGGENAGLLTVIVLAAGLVVLMLRTGFATSWRAPR